MNCRELNKELSNRRLTETQALALLRSEMAGPKRESQVKRIYVRYARLRRNRELKEYLAKC